MNVLTPDQAKLEEGRKKFSNLEVFDDDEISSNASQTHSVLDGNQI